MAVCRTMLPFFVAVVSTALACQQSSLPPTGGPSALAPDARVALAKCRDHFAADRLGEANTACTTAATQAGEDELIAEIAFLHGEIALVRKESDAALRHFATAIAAGSSSAAPHYLSGTILRDKSLFTDACDAFAAATGADNTHVAAQAELAACRIHDGDPREAKTEYQLCKRIATHGCPCEAPVAAAALANNMLDTGIRYLEAWTGDCSDNPGASLALCVALTKVGRCADAQAACAAAELAGAVGDTLVAAKSAATECR